MALTSLLLNKILITASFRANAHTYETCLHPAFARLWIPAFGAKTGISSLACGGAMLDERAMIYICCVGDKATCQMISILEA